jgi:hypothetical protein
MVVAENELHRYVVRVAIERDRQRTLHHSQSLSC